MYPAKTHIAEQAAFGSMEEYEKVYRRSLDDPEGFWSEQAEKFITWYHPPHGVKPQPPHT